MIAGVGYITIKLQNSQMREEALYLIGYDPTLHQHVP